MNQAQFEVMLIAAELYSKNLYQTSLPGYGGAGETVNLEDPDAENYELISNQDSIRLADKLECFNNVPTNANTLYSIKICADIPVNDHPDYLLNATLKPGHAFLELTKTNGAASVTETIGFYPEKNNLATILTTVNGVMVDDKGRPYDASLIKMLNATEFNNMLGAAIVAAGHDYDLTSYNCVNFALDVFNSQAGTLAIPNKVGAATGLNYGKTPNELYKAIKNGYNNQSPGASIATGTGILSTNCN